MDVNPDRASVVKLKSKPVRVTAGGSEQSEGSALPVEVKGDEPRSVSGAKNGQRRQSVRGSADSNDVALFSREQELLQALMLGLYDYMRKTNSRGYVVSLSGGCDSSSVTIAVAHMLAEAVRQNGLEATCRRLGVDTRQIASEKDLIRRVLTCVYQKTENSGPVTQEAARAVAEQVGAEFCVTDVQPAVDFYRHLAEDVLHRKLEWSTDDIALQNVQARVRVPLIWLIANVQAKILLTTSNRNEASVGYTTMDGDTAGGLAPIAGIDKHYLRKWLQWAVTQKDIGLGALSALSKVTEQQPTAELRPGSQQTDESDLMPYEVLDRIERSFVRDRMSPEDIMEDLSHDFPQIGRDVLSSYITKFFTMWTRSQWKRERMAPAFHLDDASVDSRTWCRYPILSASPV
jgi:NAD+ synthase (glutamine-hydrolysing)